MSTLVVADFNADLFARLLNNSVKEAGGVKASGYAQVFQKLIELKTETGGSIHTNLIVWVRPESMFPSLRRAIQFEEFISDALLEEVYEFADTIKAVAEKIPNIFIMSMYSDMGTATHGMLNYRPRTGIRYWIDRINVELAERLQGMSGIFLLDTSRYFNRVSSPKAYKLYYSAKIPYTIDVFKKAVQDVRSCLQGLNGKARRVLILDLDNTLWGGILGDDGLHGIRLGGHDHIGEAFSDFQQAIKRLVNRGIALAVASKNYEANALNVFDNHAEMILRRTDLSAWRINWEDKAQNIIAIAKELNLSLSSLVFIDDNPLERARVSEALPEVLVPDWPQDPAEYTEALNALTCFNVPAVSTEDAKRTEMFAAERDRQQLKSSMSHEDWLATIEMKITVESLNHSNITRIVQLMNKSNQFNAQTRRVSESEVIDIQSAHNGAIWGFRVSDKYGDSGLTGVISVIMDADCCHIIDFVMSCRVMGRGVERLMLSEAAAFATGNGCKVIVCDFLPTEHNLPMREFLDRSGLSRHGDSYRWDLAHPYPQPTHITVTRTMA